MPTKLSFPDRRILVNALCETPPFLTARGRQSLVREALGGHPATGQIEKALHYVDWEGGSELVAGELIRLLEGHEIAPGVPALSAIAEAIESLAGAEHQEKVADLRRRMGWIRKGSTAVGSQTLSPSPAAPALEPVPTTRGAIFISYASDDISAAKQLFDELKALERPGSVAWFDKSALRPGDDWEPAIMQAIRSCTYFLPLISHQTEARTEGYFRLEWREAAARSRRIQGRKFLFPIVIDPDYDGTMSRYKLVPDEFKAFQYSHAPAGRVTEVLRAELTGQLRRLRAGAADSTS